MASVRDAVEDGLPAHRDGIERVTTFVQRAHERVDRVVALDPDQPLGVPPQDIVTSQITLGSFIGASADEWHVHAWGLGLAIGERYQPADPDALLDGLRLWWPQLEARGTAGGPCSVCMVAAWPEALFPAQSIGAPVSGHLQGGT